MTKRLTMQELEEAVIIAAEVVATYGEIYLPLFEKLERAHQERLRQGSVMERARLIAARKQQVLAHQPAP